MVLGVNANKENSIAKFNDKRSTADFFLELIDYCLTSIHQWIFDLNTTDAKQKYNTNVVG